MAHTGNDLLNAAIDWYRDNGAVQIPEYSKVGGSDVFGTNYYQETLYSINSWDRDGLANSINEVRGSTIPLLAAISLGFDDISLSQIFSDHSIRIDEITGMSFDDSMTTGIPKSDGSDGTISPCKITIDAMRAFSSSMENWDTLSRSIREEPSSRECLGIMHTKETMLWPVSLINDHAEKVMTPSKNRVWSTFQKFSYAVSAPQARDELPSCSPIELIRRLGMFSEPVLRKQTGLFDHWEDLLFIAGNEDGMQKEILHSLAKVQHKPTLDLIIRGLRSFSVDSIEDAVEGPVVYKTLMEAFGKTDAFSEVFDSHVLKLNLIPLLWFGNNRELEDMTGNPDVFSPILDNKHLLVSRVAEELLSRPPHQLGHSEYAVFRKLIRMNLPLQEITFSPEKLLNHVLDSMNTYVSPNKLDCEHKRDIDLLAGESVSAMASLLIKHHDFDYTQLDERSENAKIHLIRGGFDIKKFKGLSNKAKGLILEEQIGL